MTIQKKKYISISSDGTYAIAKDKKLKVFENITLKQIQQMLSKLSDNDLKNTFVFASDKDLKRYRSKPSSTEEYRDDIEIYLIKSIDEENELTKRLHKSVKKVNPDVFSYELALENETSLKTPVAKLAKVLKQFRGINTTL